MSSYEVEVDKNTGKRKMVVTKEADQMLLALHPNHDSIISVGKPSRVFVSPRSGFTSEKLIMLLQSLPQLDEMWAIEKIHVLETDEGPIVAIVCDVVQNPKD